MKNSAFEDFSEGVMAACYDAYDFKTCQRSDGTTYGTHGDCVQKGSKEVSKSSSKKKTSKKSSWDDSNLAAKIGSEIAKVASNADILNAIRAENAANPGVAAAGFKNTRPSVSSEVFYSVKDTYNKAVEIKDQAGVAYDRGDWASAVAKYKQAYAMNDKAIANFEKAKGKFDNKTTNFKAMAGIAEQAYTMRGRIARDTDNAAKYGNMAKPNLPQSRSGKPNNSGGQSSGSRSTPNLDNVKSTGNLQQDVQNLMGAFMGDVVGGSTADGLALLDGYGRSNSRWSDGTYRTQDNNGRVQVHNSYESAKRAAKAWHTTILQGR